VAHRNGGGGMNSTPHAKTKAHPPLEEYPKVGIKIDGIGVEMLMDANYDTFDVP
jgi:hypothetical protein